MDGKCFTGPEGRPVLAEGGRRLTCVLVGCTCQSIARLMSLAVLKQLPAQQRASICFGAARQDSEANARVVLAGAIN